MRNLKRALSLTLASVMLLGMMVVGSSAAGYPDVSEEENIEAIEVLQEVGVMEGDNNGNFNPDDYVTREQMAVIMSKLLNLNYNYYQGTNPFSDVPAWAAPYVAACAANGITSGIGGGMYGAGQNVNAVQAALMMLKALGYFQYQDDFGDSYVLATVKQATEVGLFDMIDSKADQALTRNEVAQMALNALQADMVNFTGDVGTKIPTANGDVVVGYKSEYTSRTSTLAKYQAIERRTSDVDNNNNLNRGQYYIQLGEELYDGKLELREGSDDYNRPARTWLYNSKEIGSYMKKENIKAEYTGGVSYRTLYDLLGRTSLMQYDFEYYVDGKLDADGDNSAPDVTAQDILNRTNQDVKNTGRGVLTQVFVDLDAQLITITSINTYLAKATSGYNTGRETVVLEVYTSYDHVTPRTNITTETVTLQDVPAIEGVETDEFRLVRRSGKDTAAGRWKTVDVYNVDTIEDVTVTEFSRGTTTSDEARNMVSKIVADGTTYNGAVKAHYNADVLDRYNQNLLDNRTYDVYLDLYGNAIGVDIHSGVDNYVFITGYDLNNSAIANTTAKAAGIFLDGTMASIDVNVKDTDKAITRAGNAYFNVWAGTGKVPNENRWYTYTVNAAGVYTLTPATRMFTTDVTAAGTTIKCNQVRLDEVIAPDALVITNNEVGDNAAHDAKVNKFTPHPAAPGSQRAYGNDNSIYLVAELDTVSQGTGKVITGVDGRYTGVQSVEIDVFARKYTDTGSDGFGASDINGSIYDTTVNPSAPTQLYDSIYTLYDKNNYVIASVIIGEAKGTSTNYAYILGGAKTERKIGENYYWDFEAIVGGEFQTLTVESKFRGTIDDLRPGHIQELRYNGEYVSGIKAVDTSKIVNTTIAPITNNVHEVWDVGHFHGSYECDNGSGCVLVANPNSGEARLGFTVSTDAAGNITSVTGNNNLRVEGSTMYTQDGTADWGLTFTQDAKAVVIQPEYGKNNVKTYWSSVNEAIAHLADPVVATAKKEYAGRIVAVLDNRGVATWVVFISDTPLTVNPGGTVVGPQADTVTVNLQYVNSADNTLINKGKIVEGVKTGDTVTGDDLIGYICRTPDRKVLVPSYDKGTKEITLTLIYDPIAGGAMPSNDQGKANSADVQSAITGTTVNAVDGTVSTKPGSGVTPKNAGDGGERFVSDATTASIKSAISAQGPGIYHYTQELQDLLGWCQTAGQISSLQIGPNQNVDTAVFLVTINLTNDDSGYTLYLDNVPVPGASSLWTSTTGVQVLTWDEIPVGVHTYKLVANTSGNIVQAGTFEMTASNA